MNTVKKALSILLILILTFVCIYETKAQHKRKVTFLEGYDEAPYHFGFLIGVNFMDFNYGLKNGYQDIPLDGSLLPQASDLNELGNFSDSELAYYQINKVEGSKLIKNPGFSVGVIGDLRLGRYFNLRFSPTLSLSWRRVYYDLVLYNSAGAVLPISYPDGTVSEVRHVVSKDNLATYLEFPLHIKYRSKRYNNIGAYLLTGVNPKLYLISRHNIENTTGQPQHLFPKRGDVALEFGAGYDIYNQWFKMGVELKMSFGLLNLLVDEPLMSNFLWEAPFESLKSKQLQLSFTFE